MRFFQLKCLGDQSKLAEHVCISKRPKGMGLKSTLLGKAESVSAYFPDNAEVHLQEAEPGRVLTDCLSNTLWCFIANRRTRELVEQVCGREGVEYLPFTLFDSSGKVLSDDYYFIHPLKSCEAVDRAASDIRYQHDDPKGEILSVREYIFDHRLAQNLPPLFRVPEYSYDIFMNEVLARTLFDAKIANLFLHEIELR